LRRRDAEIGQRPFQGQPCRGLGLPQQVAEVAFFATLALAGGRRPDAGQRRIRGGFFPRRRGFFWPASIFAFSALFGAVSILSN
jgi:hypothetical protein